ncbi:MAG: amidohydrolase family protein [Actinobacteria bacterium]|nr:amidohydrolase family protein [Actinomycetota bacterium]
MPRLYAGPVGLFDGTGTKAEPNRGVLIEDGRIAWVGAHARAPKAAATATPLDSAAGLTVLPGLFDCHVHLCFDGDADFLAEGRASEPLAALKAARNAERHLASGVTTVRDLGTIGSVSMDVGRAVDEGRIAGARVIPSGRALTITGGHGWNSFAEQVDGPDGFREGVRRQLKSGARSIKVVATGGVLTPGVTLDFVSLTTEELAAAVDEAHRWNVPIAAHAHGEAGIVQAAQAGVDSIEHGSVAGSATMRLLAERGTFHVPTFGAHAGIVDHPDDVAPYVIEKGREIFDAARTSFSHAVRASVRHAAGTDAGTPFNRHGETPREIVRMVEYGLPVARALLAATANAAELCRVADRLGTIEVGKLGDLVAYASNPLDDVRAVLQPAVVVKDGALAVDAS